VPLGEPAGKLGNGEKKQTAKYVSISKETKEGAGTDTRISEEKKREEKASDRA